MFNPTKIFLDEKEYITFEMELSTIEPANQLKHDLIPEEIKVKERQLENSPKIKPVQNEASPSPLRLALQAYPDKNGYGISFSCPNSDDEIGYNDATLSYVEGIRKEFQKDKTSMKPLRLLSTDIVEQSKENSLYGDIQAESVFYAYNEQKYYDNEHYSVNGEEEEEDDDDDEFILTTTSYDNKKNLLKQNTILNVLKNNSKS